MLTDNMQAGPVRDREVTVDDLKIIIADQLIITRVLQGKIQDLEIHNQNLVKQINDLKGEKT